MAAITKYFVGGEVEAFVQGSHASTTWITTAGTYDSDFARGAVSLTAIDGSYIRIPLTGPALSCWVSFQEWRHSGLGGPESKTWHTFYNAGLTALYRLQGVGGTSDQPLVQFQYWSGSAWVAIGNPMIVPTSALHKFDYQLTSDGATGVLSAYVDGVLMGTLSGNTAFVSPGSLSELHTFTTTFGSGQVAISECQILDVSTLGRRLATLGETANGVNTDWTGSYTDINEVGTYNDSNFIQSGTANQVSTFVTSDLSAVAQTYAVSGLVIAGRALEGAVGPQNLKGAVVVGGTTYISSANVTGPSGLPTVFGYVWADFPNNPATGIDFTPTQINGIETGWKSLT